MPLPLPSESSNTIFGRPVGRFGPTPLRVVAILFDLRSVSAVLCSIFTGIVVDVLLLLQLGSTVYCQFRNAAEGHGVTTGHWLMRLCPAVHLHLLCLRSSAHATNSEPVHPGRYRAVDQCCFSATVSIYYLRHVPRVCEVSNVFVGVWTTIPSSPVNGPTVNPMMTERLVSVADHTAHTNNALSCFCCWFCATTLSGAS